MPKDERIKQELLDGSQPYKKLVNMEAAWEHLKCICVVRSIIIACQSLSKADLSELAAGASHIASQHNDRVRLTNKICNNAERLIRKHWNFNWFQLFKEKSADWIWSHDRYLSLRHTLRDHPLIRDTRQVAEKRSEGPFIIAFDEVADLEHFDEVNGLDQSEYEKLERKRLSLVYALTRVLTIFAVGPATGKESPVWSIYATTRCINYIPEPRASEPDLRWPSFHSFAWDIYDNISENQTPSQVLTEKLDQWGTLDHRQKFGRPLWNSYDETDLNFGGFVLAKLNIGRFPFSYYGWNYIDYAKIDGSMSFAILSHLVVLNPTIRSTEGFNFLRDQVHGHLRYCENIDFETQTLKSQTISDPPLAHVLIAHCRKRPSLFGHVQDRALKQLQNVSLDVGEFGELYARITAITARLEV
ncbi:MAG: hypothetical protein M1820_003853 [Bogoriella megaspora]|nr:MAG: hypothetical protein M1820_003853 [Bogoriella megaspora]